MNDWIIRGFEVKTAHSAMAGNSNQLVVMNGTYLMKSRYKIPALVCYKGLGLTNNRLFSFVMQSHN